ncbi:MAG: dihydrofolate reductase family protein, partial [Nitrososphaera sp.]
SQVRTIVAVTSDAPDEKVAKIRETGAEVLVVRAGKGYNVVVPRGVDLKELFSILESMGIKKALVEGGGELNWSLLRLGMVDELTVTVAPKIAGGRLATTLVEGDGFDRVADGIKLTLERVERKKSGELVLRYRLG